MVGWSISLRFRLVRPAPSVMESRRQSLQSVLEAIDRIRLYTEEGREIFFNDPLVQEAVCRNLQIIRDECTRTLPELISSFRLLGPESPVTLLCNPEQDYFETGQATVWSILEEELSALRAVVLEKSTSSE